MARTAGAGSGLEAVPRPGLLTGGLPSGNTLDCRCLAAVLTPGMNLSALKNRPLPGSGRRIGLERAIPEQAALSPAERQSGPGVHGVGPLKRARPGQGKGLDPAVCRSRRCREESGARAQNVPTTEEFARPYLGMGQAARPASGRDGFPVE